ncbi:hypothetical protein [Bordetella flabilis]|uniref:DUF1488 domain-containing protein n=1 Tax=Bordetella flabilis TaxID=463014 RepID=A0A193GAE7_9BORD|nr:hypothetical protein [Bordetella flabilis]ANN76972.1 hypothetical protein BAU07_07480 [Bordetella flabilis]
MSFDPDAHVQDGDVHYAMHFPDGVRAVRVTRGALCEYFGADGTPERMLDAYRANFRAIHAVAQLLGDRHAGEVTVTSADLAAVGPLAMSASPPSDKK